MYLYKNKWIQWLLKYTEKTNKQIYKKPKSTIKSVTMKDTQTTLRD